MGMNRMKVIKLNCVKMRRAIYLLSTVIVISGAVGALLLFNTLFKNNTTKGVSYVYIPSNSQYEELIDSLNSSKRVININTFKRAAAIEKFKNNIKPGRYKILEGMNNRTLVRMFKLGLQTPLNLTFSGNIRSLERLSAIISTRIESDSLSVYNVLNDKKLTDSLGFDSLSFPGMFIQNTYEVYWTTKPKDLIVRLHREYNIFWNEERRSKALQIGLSPKEVTTLASIVAQESNIKSEHPLIAGVYINRIKNGIPLQADPTIKFALNDPSLKRILYKHLEIESPYNTYKKRGLPPGPIVLPSPGVIDSVLNYSKHNYLYFCAKPSLDGSHSFASTLQEHNRNARAYHNAIRGLK